MARAIDKTIDVRTSSSLGGRLADYAQLFKVRLSLLVVFSAGIGYLVAGGMIQNFAAFISLILGGMLVTGASNTINQILEKDTDALMERTAGRPLAAKRMKVGEAAVLAGLSGVVGIALLTLVFNPVAGVLAALKLNALWFLVYSAKTNFIYCGICWSDPGSTASDDRLCECYRTDRLCSYSPVHITVLLAVSAFLGYRLVKTRGLSESGHYAFTIKRWAFSCIDQFDLYQHALAIRRDHVPHRCDRIDRSYRSNDRRSDHDILWSHVRGSKQ